MKCPCCGQQIPASDHVTVSLETNTITVRGRAMAIEPRAAEILFVLAARMPAPVSRSTIMAKVWGLGEATAKNVDVHVCRLRRLLTPLGLTISKYREGRNTLSGGYALVDTTVRRSAAA